MADLSTARAASAERLVDRVLAPATMGALARVRLRVAHASGERPGHTRVRNRSDATGSELDRHVPYSPGDDLRRVDWATYARLGELLTRRFVAEREVPVWVLVDTSPSMGPAGPSEKIDMAAAVAGVLGVVSLSGGDRLYVGALPGRGGSIGTLGPLRGRHGLNSLRAFLETLTPNEREIPFAPALERALQHIRHGLVVLISDFLIPPEEIAPALDVIRSRKCEGKLVQVLSREDLDPSWLRGRDTLVDRETGEEYHIEPSTRTWEQYEAALQAHIEDLRRTAIERGMSTVLTVSDIGLEQFLRDELPRLGLSLVR